MKILIVGANGFLGRRLRLALTARGHRLRCTSRHPPPADSARAGEEWVAVDLAAPVDWAPLLAGIDAVVNAAGRFGGDEAAYAALHTDGPIALFEACAAAGVGRVLQISALGSGGPADDALPFLRSKRLADARLLALPLDATVARPSLVFGPEGRSTRALMAAASLPALPLPAGGGQAVQPVHVDDAVAALCALVEARGRRRGRVVALVGPAAMTLRDYLATLRAALGRGPLRAVPVPGRLVAALARLAGRLDTGLDRDAWALLEGGSTGDPADLRALGVAPRPAAAFIRAEDAAALALAAAWPGMQALARLALAAVWLASAAVSFGLYPVELGAALLGEAGVPAALQRPMLYGAAALDALLGVLTLAPLAPRRQRRLWAAQALLVACYSAVVTVTMPAFWLHPFGPMTKNLPILALLALLAWAAVPPRPWTTSSSSGSTC